MSSEPRRTRLKYLSITIGMTLLLSIGTAWTQDFAPARFGDDARSPLNTIVVPYGRPPGAYDVSVTCQVIVKADGSTVRPHCLTDERYDAFRREVLAAVEGASIEPAKIDGKPVDVVMSFMAGFRCLEICSILLLENHARHVDEQGLGYSAPQPVLEGETWYRGFEEKLAWAASGQRGHDVGGVKFMVSTDIDETGRSSRRRVVQASSGYRSTASSAARSLDDVRYIPGFKDGNPIKLRLYEYWLDPEGKVPDTIELPVRVHLLSSEFVDTLNSTIDENGVRQFFDDVNALWRPAGIRWEIESTVEIDAERQLAFRRIVDGSTDIDFSANAYDVFARLCPRETWLQGGWNVCFIGAFPWVAAHFGEGFVILGEFDAQDHPVQPFALARELGETLGALDAPRCTSRFLPIETSPDDPFEGACATTAMNDFQIRITRRQAAKGRPSCPRPIRHGEAGGNWMSCLLQEAPEEHLLTVAPAPGTSLRRSVE